MSFKSWKTMAEEMLAGINANGEEWWAEPVLSEVITGLPALLAGLISDIEKRDTELAETPCDCTRGVLGYEHKGNCQRRIAYELIGKDLPSVEEEDQR